jgi:methylmalonyl-CoA mutase, C-terminal domain
MSQSSSDHAHARVLVAKTSLDGHWRGLQVIAKTLRDGGFEVILIGMARDDEIAAAAVNEDVDLIGLNVGGRIEVVERILDKLVESGVDAPVIAGGTISPPNRIKLEERGVATFPPGSSLEDIVTTARRLVEERRTNGNA